MKLIEGLLLLKKANVLSSSSCLPPLPQIKELEAPRIPWAGRLKMIDSTDQ